MGRSPGDHLLSMLRIVVVGVLADAPAKPPFTGKVTFRNLGQEVDEPPMGIRCPGDGLPKG